MAHFKCTIYVDTTTEEAFDYMARFSNAQEWDPSVTRASMITAEPVGPNSAFEVVVRSAGRELPFRYEITEYHRPDRVVLRARRGVMESEDTVTVTSTLDGRTALTYEADLRLTGPLRFFDPVLGLVFDGIANRGAQGLRTTFEAKAASSANPTEVRTDEATDAHFHRPQHHQPLGDPR